MEKAGKPAVLDLCSDAVEADVRAEAKRKATAAAREKDDARRAEAALKEKERRDSKKRNPSTSGAVSGIDSQRLLGGVGDGGAGAQRPPQTGAGASEGADAAAAQAVRDARARSGGLSGVSQPFAHAPEGAGAGAGATTGKRGRALTGDAGAGAGVTSGGRRPPRWSYAAFFSSSATGSRPTPT